MFNGKTPAKRGFDVETINALLSNPLLMLAAVLVVLREIHVLIGAIKALVEARNTALLTASNSVLMRLDTLIDVLRAK